MHDKEFHIIEGMTCSGKTTFVNDVMKVFGASVLLEHPPIEKGQRVVDFRDHQELVFDAFVRNFDAAPNGIWYVDYSPFGCFPFTKALMDTGHADELGDLLVPMKRVLDALCKRHDIFLHRYMPVEPAECLRRLARRQRYGDDTWSPELIEALARRYNEFFQGDLILKTDDRIRGLRDGCESYLPLS